MFEWQEEESCGTALFRGQQIFRLNFEDLYFDDIVLRPGGKPLLRGLFRWRRTGWIDPVQIDTREVTGAGPECLSFLFETRADDCPSIRNRTTVEVTYDGEGDRLLYHATSKLSVIESEFKGTFPSGLEFFNFLANPTQDDMLVPGTFDHMGRWKGHTWVVTSYQHFLYESPHGAILLPINQYIFSRSQSKPIKAGGRCAFYNHPDGIPTVRLLEGADVSVYSARCHLCHDEHVCGVLSEEAFAEIPVGLQKTAELVLYDSAGAEAEELLASARVLPLTEEDKGRMLPQRVIQEKGFDSFEDAHPMDRANSGFFWVPIGGWERRYEDWFWASPPLEILQSRCIWEQQFGRTGLRSLKIVTDRDMRAGWESQYQPIRLRPDSNYLLTAWVRTENLSGKGAFLGYFFGPDQEAHRNSKPYEVRHQPDGVIGTNDWTKVQLAFKSPNYGGLADIFIRFWHEGTGASWWDDVSLVCLDDEYHETLNYRKVWQILPHEVMNDVRPAREEMRQ